MRNPENIPEHTVPAGWRMEWEDEPFRVRQRRMDLGANGAQWSTCTNYGWLEGGAPGRYEDITYIVSIEEDD